MARKHDREIVASSGNVFTDLRVRGAGNKRAKIQLAIAVNRLLQQRRLSQTSAARLLGISQPNVSALAHYRVQGFSVERLLRLLTLLDRDVEIVVRRKPRSRRNGTIQVTAA